MPDFARHAVEVEICAPANAQDDDAPVEVGSREFLVLNENAVDCDAHSPQAPLPGAGERRTRAAPAQACAVRRPARALLRLRRADWPGLAAHESQTTAIIRSGPREATTSRRRSPVSRLA